MKTVMAKTASSAPEIGTSTKAAVKIVTPGQGANPAIMMVALNAMKAGF